MVKINELNPKYVEILKKHYENKSKTNINFDFEKYNSIKNSIKNSTYELTKEDIDIIKAGVQERIKNVNLTNKNLSNFVHELEYLSDIQNKINLNKITNNPQKVNNLQKAINPQKEINPKFNKQKAINSNFNEQKVNNSQKNNYKIYKYKNITFCVGPRTIIGVKTEDLIFLKKDEKPLNIEIITLEMLENIKKSILSTYNKSYKEYKNLYFDGILYLKKSINNLTNIKNKKIEKIDELINIIKFINSILNNKSES
jgi:hypothetical protein